MIGFEEKTLGAEGGTRHALFAGVRPCPSRACNGPFLSVVRCVFVLKFAGVAVRVAVQDFSGTAVQSSSISLSWMLFSQA